jgi:hypothetical protein
MINTLNIRSQPTINLLDIKAINDNYYNLRSFFANYAIIGKTEKFSPESDN